MGSGHFPANELYTRKLEALPSALHTTQAKLYILDNNKNNNVSEHILGSVCIDEYILIPGKYLIFFSKI